MESQIGKIIGMSQQGVSKLLKRVWAKLAEELKEYSGKPVFAGFPFDQK